MQTPSPPPPARPALTIVRDSDACERASAFGAELRAALNGVLEAEGVPWSVYGTFSSFHLFMTRAGARSGLLPSIPSTSTMQSSRIAAGLVNKVRLGLLVNAWPSRVGPAA